MMPSRSTPNLRDPPPPPKVSYYAASRDSDDSPPPAPPVRDSSTLKSVKYGPGHEKFPSWPVPAAAETPQAIRAPPSGGSHRSKSWTDHTNYPKEKVVAYTRPYMKRPHSNYAQQKLKTVMEKCEKITPETYYDKMSERLYLPPQHHHAERDTGSAPSPPERDLTKPRLTKADLEEYARSYQEPPPGQIHLTESELEDFMKYSSGNYEDTFKHHETIITHQKQVSYAQSEGYHSYVSSTDSTSTPFLDRLRRDSEAVVVTRPHASWDDLSEKRREGRDSVVTTSSGSASSSETLKWHGSMSDVSVASSCTHTANSSSSKQLIAHSAKVQTPQRHHSESVLYIGGESQDGWKDRESRNNSANKLKLFAVNTYTMQENEGHGNKGSSGGSGNRLSYSSMQASLSVADRISELEKQQKYSYLDPDKRHKVPDPTLKAIQKKALLSFYERHHNSTTNKTTAWHSEPQLAQSLTAAAAPQPPPRAKVQYPSRRASSAADYKRGLTPKHQHSNSCGSLSTDLLGPVIMGPSISVDDYVPEKPPERPPKNPHLRLAYPDLFKNQRVPSPDLPPPSPPTVLEDEVYNSDEPLPPPPPEIEWDAPGKQFAAPQVEKKSPSYQISALDLNRGCRKDKLESPIKETPSFLERNSNRYASVRTSIKTRQPFLFEPKPTPSLQKLVLNGNIAVSQKLPERCRAEILHDGKIPATKDDPTPDQYRAELVRTRYPSPEGRNVQRASIAESPSREVPPPLQPRQMRINQSMRARISDGRMRSSPPKERIMEGKAGGYNTSQSKASYLTSRRNNDPNAGVYKRTMSPSGHVLTEDTTPPEKDTPPQPPSLIQSTGIYRRASMNSSGNKSKHCDSNNGGGGKEQQQHQEQLVLPDVLPVNAKLRQFNRPTQLSLAPEKVESCRQRFIANSPKISPKSSPKSPTQITGFSPLRTTNLTSCPFRTTPEPPPTSSPIRLQILTTTTSTSPPHSPLKEEDPPPPPTTSSSSSSSSPLRTSPLSSTSSSPKISRPSSPDGGGGGGEECCPKVVEGLQMIQRTEVTLRVNASTTDASSQTETTTPLPTRRKLQEEIECEELSQDFVSQLHNSDRLKGLLVPGPEHKKPTDYVSGLFRVDVTSRPRPENSPFRSRTNTPSSSPPPVATTTITNKINDSTAVMSVVPNLEPSSPLSSTSTYFTISEPKAKFLTRYSRDMKQYNVLKNTKDLNQKKEELVSRLDRKLEVLRNEQLVVSEECRINDELGENVAAHVNRVARPHEAAKYRLHVEEVGKITSLLLGLSGRLARAENALMGMSEDHIDKKILESKRDKLLEQLEEAKKLKENIDRRSVNVSNILYKYLSSEEYSDYDHFINMKAKLIMDAKEIGDKIKLGEEQLMALKETLIVTD